MKALKMGHGAKKAKSLDNAGADNDIKLLISGLLIINCIPIQEPKEKPATQQWVALGFCVCIQSIAVAASVSSPSPSSYDP